MDPERPSRNIAALVAIDETRAAESRTRQVTIMKEVEREILLSFWKVHILYHAEKEPIIGQWVIRELRRHGYEVSPGTLYPILARMERRGWLIGNVDPSGGLRARREYTLTDKGRGILALLRVQVQELYREVVLDEEDDHHT